MRAISRVMAIFVFVFVASGAVAQDQNGSISLSELTLNDPIVSYGTFGESRIISVTLTPEWKIEVVYRSQDYSMVLLSIPPQTPPPSIWKDIYACHDGKIVLEKRVYAKVTPEHTIRESYEFEGDER